MALHGTLEVFSIPEVLHLLATTRKTGELVLDGDRGAGSVTVRDGNVTGARTDLEDRDDIDHAVFDMLRVLEGSFRFEPSDVGASDVGASDDETSDAKASDGDGPEADTPDGAGRSVDDVLGAAEAILAEWREIEVDVPSLDIRVRLVDELGDASVTLDADQWKTIAIVGGGTSGHRLASRLGRREIDTCRGVRALLELGVVEIDTSPPVNARPDRDETGDAAPDPHDGASGDRGTVNGDPDGANGYDADAFLAELATFSPRAREAVEATVGEATNPAGHEAGLNGQDAGPAAHDDAVEAPSMDDMVDDVFDDVFEAADVEPHELAEAMGPYTDDESDRDTPDHDAPDRDATGHDAAHPIDEPATGRDGAEHDTTFDTDALFAEVTGKHSSLPEPDLDFQEQLHAEVDPAPAASESGERKGDEELNRNLLLKFLSSARS